MREQNLRRVQPEAGEGRLVSVHEPHLSDGGCCLQGVHRRGTLGPAEPLHALGDRA